MGGLVIEAYMNAEGIIEVMRDPDYPGNPMRADYVVFPTILIKDAPPIPSQTMSTPIKPVTQARQDNGRTVIKRMDKEYKEEFVEIISAGGEPFIHSVDNPTADGMEG